MSKPLIENTSRTLGASPNKASLPFACCTFLATSSSTRNPALLMYSSFDRSIARRGVAACDQARQLLLGGLSRAAVEPAGEFRDHDVARAFMGKFHRGSSPSVLLDRASYHAAEAIVNRCSCPGRSQQM